MLLHYSLALAGWSCLLHYLPQPAVRKTNKNIQIQSETGREGEIQYYALWILFKSKPELSVCFPRQSPHAVPLCYTGHAGIIATLGALAGWKRMALLIAYFSPEHLRDPVTFPNIGGRLIVMPVVQTLCFGKCPGATRKWIDAITQEWDFTKVISAHFSAPVDAGPADVRYGFRNGINVPSCTVD